MGAEAERVAVTGARGRLGRAAVAAFRDAGAEVVPLSRPDYDLDDPAAAERALASLDIELVVHAAAWTDVDGCATQPELAERRNGTAVGELAAACATRSVGLLLVSTNEVFDGLRTDGHGYAETDEVAPPNAYGRSKLAGERAATPAFGGGRDADAEHPGLWIVRTSWLFGPPGNDFPERIVAAADRLPAGVPLRVVADEFGAPTASVDLAAALVRLVAATDGGRFHLVNAGHVSRSEWARHVLRRARRTVALEPIGQAEYERASTPPRWGVLSTERAASLGIGLRPWQEALNAYLDGWESPAAQEASAAASGGLA